jgi:hypothetical protein
MVGLARGIEPIPEAVDSFLVNYCLDCHDSNTEKGEINLDYLDIDWNAPHSVKLWNKVHDVLLGKEMPPENKSQPDEGQRTEVLAWLHKSLLKHDATGGTVLRRLNKEEYENSVSIALGIPFKVSEGFPNDPDFHGFNNIGEGLVLSPPLMQQYFELAGKAADLIIPTSKAVLKVAATTTELSPEDFSASFEASQLRDGVLRLVTHSPIVIRSCSWPTRFEAQYTGTYRFKGKFSAFKPMDDRELNIELLVVPPTVSFSKTAGLICAAKLKIPADGKVHEVKTEFDLEKGQTVAVYWANAPIGSDNHLDLQRRLKENPRLFSAWLKIGFDRKRSPKQTWALLKKTMADPDLEISSEDPPDRYPAQGLNQLGWALENMHMELGPGLNIHGATFYGPTTLKENREEKAQLARTTKFLGDRQGRSDAEYAEAILRPFLDRAFRRPVTDAQLAEYTAISLAHRQAGNSFEAGIHLALRAGLCSTHFLFRGHREAELDDYDLASRLSFFLTSCPPDSKITKLAAAGKLSNLEVLEQEARRLIKDRKSHTFLQSFLGQWLDLDVLPDIMPDERLIKRWVKQDLAAITSETQLFVKEILDKNLPLETFIDPDFTYLNKRNAALYRIRDNSLERDQMTRVPLEKGHRHGGILGQASVMMATANGVDTQPVLRGVWLLENVLGDPPSDPPNNIPAVEPDTTGAKSIRDLLEKHNADQSCAGCHSKIDPPGFALESFDPIGRWREHYPVHAKDESGKVITRDGLKVDTASKLTDGTPLNDVSDLKKYLVENIDLFSNCVANKLLTYSTGRIPTFGDRQEILGIVETVQANGNGFQDLLVEVILSEAFRTK